MRKTLYLFLYLFLFLPAPVLAAAPANWGTTADQPAQLCKGLEFVFTRSVQAAVGLVGLATFIMLLMGGIKLITSGGEAKQTTEARNTITFAVAGLALLVLSIFILRFIKTFTGVDVLTFAVCRP